MKTKYLKVKAGAKENIGQFPNFSASGSIAGMKATYYGKKASLVRCGAYIYNVPYSFWCNVEAMNACANR
jgi:hypothetical protein